MTVIGAGRVGSIATLAAAMAGARFLRLYDHDRLDPGRNLTVQLYPASDIAARREKVHALSDLVRSIVPGVAIRASARRFEGNRSQRTDAVVLIAVDTMAWRAAIAERLLRRRGIRLLLDPRIGGSVMQCLHLRDRWKPGWYRDTLHGDDEAWGAACADSPDPHTAFGAAAFVAGALRSWALGRPFPSRIAVDFDSGGFLVEEDSPSPRLHP